jgi:hypothetical protein
MRIVKLGLGVFGVAVAAGVLANCETNTGLAAPWTTVTGIAPEVIQVDDNYSWTNPPATNTNRPAALSASRLLNVRSYWAT